MGDVILLDDRRRPRQDAAAAAPAHRASGPRAPRVTFAFDLSSPWTYLAAERVERLLPGVVWQPVLEGALRLPAPGREAAEARAHALGLPLVWPDEGTFGPDRVRPAMRVAALAAERGRAAPFVLAASRLAFCGGFELDDPEVLAEAAAAAELGLAETLAAARDADGDARMQEAARKLVAQGAERLPALRVGRLLFGGEDRLGEAIAAAQAPATATAV